MPDTNVVEAWLERLTVEEKVGQLLIPRADAAAPATAYVDDLTVGGFILDRALSSGPEQIARYVMALRSAARRRNDIPLFVACDQEGGDTAFMRMGATEVPSNMGLAATPDPSAAVRDAATILATELRAVGVNWDLAPVVDVNTCPENPVIGVRAYADDPQTVAILASQAITAFQGAGLLACAKHFPGHGDTNLDSHVALPTIAGDRRRLDDVELAPFRAAITAGVASVMTAHVRVPALDAERIGTLSSAILTDLLRGTLRFEGIVVTDAMDMAGVSDGRADEAAAVESVRAGADAILTRRGFERNARVHAALLRAVRSRAISESRFASALRRVLSAKAGLPAPAEGPFASTVGSAEHRRRALELARNCITIVRDDPPTLPLDRGIGDRLLVVTHTATSGTYLGQSRKVTAVLGEEIALRIPRVVDLRVGSTPTDVERAAILRAAARARVIVVATLDAVFDPDQVVLLKAIRDAAPEARIVVVAMRSPYDLLRVPWAATYVCSYASVAPVVSALAEVLCGEIAARGHLPIALAGSNRHS